MCGGWGKRGRCENRASCEGRTETLDRLRVTGQNARGDAADGEVGLPTGQMGDSEVGHMNLGAGRVVRQDLPRIDAAIADGSFARIPAVQEAVATLKKS